MTTPKQPARDQRGRFRSVRPCRIERIIGGYWCHTHHRWADTHTPVMEPKP